MNRNYETDYYFWLCSLVDVGPNDPESRMLRCMYDKEFITVLDRDLNRVSDGMGLRSEFRMIDDDDPPVIFDYMNCNVLEVLIALARAMDFELCGANDLTDRTEQYFWELVGNLGLSTENEEDWNDILDRWMERAFRPSGAGSPFPLRKPGRDQREVEMWYQLNAYLAENYPIEEARA